MSGGIILIVIIAFICNRIFGLYDDETTRRILEEAGTLKPKRPSPRAGGNGYPNQVRKGQRPNPYKVKIRKNSPLLDMLAAREARPKQMTARTTRIILNKYGLEG